MKYHLIYMLHTTAIMTQRKLFLLVICALISSSVFSQGIDKKYFVIPWNNEIVSDWGRLKTLMGLEGAVYLPEKATLPLFAIELSCCEGMDISVSKLNPVLTDTIDPSIAIELADLDLLGEDFEYFDAGVSANRQRFNILPLRSRNGIVERLKAFELSYTVEHAKTMQFDEPIPVYAASSVLASGDWYKIGILDNGIYKIDYSDLLAFGLNPVQTDPRKIRLFGNGSGMLPESNSKSRIDDLLENAIFVSGEDDGTFDQGDYILFYGSGPLTWTYNLFTGRFEAQKNYYTDTTYYFINVGDKLGKRTAVKNQAGGPVTQQINTFVDMQHHEVDEENLLLSGKEWFGETFSTEESEREFIFDMPGLKSDQALYFNMQFIARAITEDVAYSVYANDSLLVDKEPILKLAVNQSTYARESNQILTFFTHSSPIKIKIKFYATDISSHGWLNFILVNAWRNLAFSQGQLEFRNNTATGAGNITQYNIATSRNELQLWEITNPLLPAVHQFSTENNQLNFKAVSDSLRQYILFDKQSYKPVASVSKIPNQNLHGLEASDMLIISHPDFLAEAKELSKVHLLDEGLESVVVDVNQVYNEFGGGSPDVSAIRDFVRMSNQRSNGRMRYLLLFGDASYDYKNRLSANTNFVPTYESKFSLTETGSFVSDDYFGLLDQNEGLNMAGNLDIGIGRFPVKTKVEAAVMVDKISRYLARDRQQMRDWRNEITFVADDQDNNLHLDQAEALTRIVDTARSILNVRKIYLDSYQQLTVPGGERYPDANEAFVNQVGAGSLIVNYTGHGGINGLSDEKVLTVPDITAFTNISNMPLFITATCEFSRFDDPHFVSAGERLLLNPNGGGIGLMTTTRLAWAHSNFALNRKIYMAMFNSQVPGLPRLGDVVRISKNPSSSSIYNFVLLGDPALRLVSPSRRVVTTQFNESPPGQDPDTIRAMSFVTIRGQIELEDGSVDTAFNGYLMPKVFDKKSAYRTLGNDNNSIPITFSYFDKVLFSGKITIKDGLFSFGFALPKDISFQYGLGKISYYAIDSLHFTDASGLYSNMVIGGTDSQVIPDETGPDIAFYLDNNAFMPGDVTGKNPLALARLSDPQGINYLGNSIGRDITLNMDDETGLSWILNKYYVPETDSFSTGSLAFPLVGLENGRHTLKLKVWDLHNNSSEAEIWFIVDDRAPLALHQVSNYPNPFSTTTSFQFNHNKPDGRFEVIIDIYRLDGQLVATIASQSVATGNHISPIVWDGRSPQGKPLPTGIYLYRMQVTDDKQISTVVNSKLIITR